MEERKKFAILFRQFNEHLEAAKIQGFTWNESVYSVPDENSGQTREITMALDERTYLILAKRYKEMFETIITPANEDVPYDIDGYLISIDTDKIDTDYMNLRFEKYLKLLHLDETDEKELSKAEDELHQTFASLSQEEQKYANIFLHDIQSGDVEVITGKTFREYVVDYASGAKDDQIHRLAKALGLDEMMLRKLMAQYVTEDNINEFGRFDALKATIDKSCAHSYFEGITGRKMPIPKVNVKADSLLRDFIFKGGYDIELPKNK